jgi:hypothetical protein
MSDTQQDPSWWQASDGKWYPPQSAQQQGWGAPQGGQQLWGPPPAPSQGNNGCLKVGLIVLGVLAVLGIAFVACVAVVGREIVEEIERQTGEANPADYDIELTECGVDDSSGWAEASGRITNTSDDERAFEVIVRFTTPGGDLIERSSTLTSRLDAGQSTGWSTVSSSEIPDGEVECELRGVNYTLFGN